jgi:zinc transport system ATP-binding protein
MAVLELKNIGFVYDKYPVLENISFSIEQGEYVALVGPNGGGKTTLLKIILGILKPTTGQVVLSGKPSSIGYVPQKLSRSMYAFPATVEEVVMTGRVAERGLFHFFNNDDQRAVSHALHIADIAQYRHRLVSELSGGQAQRVLIARALASEPKMLILDEPTTGIDASSEGAFYQFLSHLRRELNITILFVSHDLDAITREATHCLCLNHRLVCHGIPSEILQHDNFQALYGEKFTFVPHKH